MQNPNKQGDFPRDPPTTDRKSENSMATLAAPKKYPYVLKKGYAAAFEKGKSTKEEVQAMKERAELFQKYCLKKK